MTTLTFYGSSDGIFCAGVLGSEDEFYDPFSVIVEGEGGQLVVNAEYGGQGVWTVGVAPVDEDIAIPAWPMRYALAESGYSSQLFIDVPGKATVRQPAA